MNGLSYLIILHDQEAGRTLKNVLSLNFVWAWNSSPRSMYPRCRCLDSLIYIILAYIKKKDYFNIYLKKKTFLRSVNRIILNTHSIINVPSFSIHC
jgi:hypothetical protein